MVIFVANLQYLLYAMGRLFVGLQFLAEAHTELLK